VNTVELVADPLGFVTVIFPVEAPAGTVAVILVDEFTVNLAETPPNLTAVVPVKFVPLIVTDVPTGPLVGENEEIVGFAGVVTVNAVSLQSDPPGVVTQIFPVVAPEGTVAVIFVAELTLNVVDVPANVTLVAPDRFVPLIVTEVPTGPLVGENDEMTGAAITVKFEPLVAVPSGVVTLIGPVVAPEGTCAVIFVLEFPVNVADVPLNLTVVAPMRSPPLMVTDVPTPPLVGENDEIVGAAAHDAGATAIATMSTAATIAALAGMPVLARDIRSPPPDRAGGSGTRSWHIRSRGARGTSRAHPGRRLVTQRWAATPLRFQAMSG
jgi:hypothetical protein